MKAIRVVAILVIGAMTTRSGFADSPYRDPQGRFTQTVPTGWTALPGEHDLKLVRGHAYAQLLMVDGQATPAPGRPVPPPQDPGSGGTEFRAPDGSFTCTVPAGWRIRSASVGVTPVHILEPENGGDERILVSSSPATANTIQEIAQQAMMIVSQQLMPGLRPVSAPSISQTGGFPVAEISYVGFAAAGQVSWWQGILLKDRMSFSVLGGARADRAQLVEQQSRTVFRSIRPGKPPANTGVANTGLATAIIGTWSFYDRSGVTGGSSSKQLTFYPNGRFEYAATTYIPNLPSDVDPTTRSSGTYRLNGNTLTAQSDNGQQATFMLQLVQGGALSINGELFIRER